MIFLVAIGLGLLAGFAAGGRLKNLAHLHFRWPWLVVAVLVVREATVLTPLHRVEDVQYVYAASLAGLVAWTLWHIRRVPGIWLVAAGSALNLVVIVTNGGRMPVAPELAGSLVQRGHAGQYIVMASDTRLNWLADWIVLRLGLVEIYSPGDLVVALGIAVHIAMAMRSGGTVEETPPRIVSDPP
ncbi:MAG: hypothetical protein NVS1B3_09040 [Candidatus Dormibacteraceae bacterium]